MTSDSPSDPVTLEPGSDADESGATMPHRATDWARRRTTLFLILLVVVALPVLLFGTFPSRDGPAHLANGAIYVDFDRSALDTYFQVQVFPVVPNVLADLVLGVMLLFLSPFLAERLLALVLIVGLPLVVHWCLMQLNRGSAWLSLLAVPLGASLVLYFGFYSFLMGMVLSLVALGLWIREIRSDGFRLGTVARIAGLMILVYLSHPLPLLALIMFMTAASYDEWVTQRRLDRRAAHKLGVRHGLAILSTSLLPLILLAVYALDQDTTSEYGRSLSRRLATLPVDALVTYSNREIPFALLVSLGIALLAGVAFWRFRSGAMTRPGFLIATLILTVVFFAIPNEIGPGGVVLPRIALLIMIAAVLWLGTLSHPGWPSVAIMFIAVIATVGLTVVRIPIQAELDEDVGEYLTGFQAVEADSVALPIWLTEQSEESRVNFPRKHWISYLTAAKDVVDLSHFPAYVDAFPVDFPPEYDIRAFTDSDRASFVVGGGDLVDAETYTTESPGEIDYVLIWGRGSADPELLESDDFTEFTAWLRQGYERIFVSSPRGSLEIFGRVE